jgi:hypothetical protein
MTKIHNSDEGAYSLLKISLHLKKKKKKLPRSPVLGEKRNKRKLFFFFPA